MDLLGPLLGLRFGVERLYDEECFRNSSEIVVLATSVADHLVPLGVHFVRPGQLLQEGGLARIAVSTSPMGHEPGAEVVELTRA